MTSRPTRALSTRHAARGHRLHRHHFPQVSLRALLPSLVAVLAAACNSSPAVDLTSEWGQRCVKDAAVLEVAPPNTPTSQIVREAFHVDGGCSDPVMCAEAAGELAQVIHHVHEHYLTEIGFALLLEKALAPIPRGALHGGATSYRELLRDGLDGVFSVLDGNSRYWVLDSSGRASAEGTGLLGRRRAQPGGRRSPGVTWRVAAPGIGYIGVHAFEVDTGLKLHNAMAALKTALPGRLAGLVLDLRDNSGGLLSAGVSVADSFLSGGRIVSVKGRTTEDKLEFTANPQDILEGAPIVVLINQGTASAAEIVAGALRDHGRAKLLGTPTFGKGSVQTSFLVGCRVLLRLTTARYYTPGGQSIDNRGLHPDILLVRAGRSGWQGAFEPDDQRSPTPEVVSTESECRVSGPSPDPALRCALAQLGTENLTGPE